MNAKVRPLPHWPPSRLTLRADTQVPGAERQDQHQHRDVERATA